MTHTHTGHIGSRSLSFHHSSSPLSVVSVCIPLPLPLCRRLYAFSVRYFLFPSNPTLVLLGIAFASLNVHRNCTIYCETAAAQPHIIRNNQIESVVLTDGVRTIVEMSLFGSRRSSLAVNFLIILLTHI